ncbi:YwmB family TATA-box binding protein [Metabacillus litoralis]|uniref:YwmB family TATA-box binding protein n=1 Tax=Metabacillus litoralis TaxID=152268 RepID=UPI00203C3540|nr:YwmB family TATA-box binding protein [Metabacillus litoralis]MCM3163804.1 YwmB family TATA-box binding protein [Metabacillus litoralis]
MRYKGIGIMVLTLSILFSFVANHIGATERQSKLLQIAKGMEHQDIDIKEWSLYAKQVVSNKSIGEVKQMTDQYRQFNWTFSEDDNVHKAIGVYNNREKNVTEKLQILNTLTNNQSQSYILYEVKGVNSQKNWNNINEYFQTNAFDIFHEKPTTFACMAGIINDNMEGVLNQKSKNLLKEFEAKPVEQLQEPDFLSVSAKTPIWEDTIPTDENNMNIQIALRTDGLGGKTTVVIGTPIITSEY